MKKYPGLELPIRSKIQMVEEIVQILKFLHEGKKGEADPLLDDLRLRALFLDEEIQKGVLIFSNQVQFQYSYDPFHKITPEVEVAADRLIEDLGFNLKSIKAAS